MTIETESRLPASEGARLFDTTLPKKALTPADDGYDAARFAWNVAYDQRPALVVNAENTTDVVEAVRYARRSGLPLAVQSTGHGVLGQADGAVLINTSRMKGLRIDPQARTAWVEAGVKWGQVLEQAQQYGLAPMLGSSPDVGAVGYTLGGGMGWLARKYGMSVDNVNRMEVVTPDGELRCASETENPDLFWALRGGGGGFGVVLGMEIRLHPVAQVYAGNLFYPAELAPQVFARFERWAADAPDELTTSIVLMNYPPFPQLPDILRGQSFVIVRGCYTGSMEEGQRLLSYWRGWQAPLIDDFKPLPFSQADQISQDPVDPMPTRMTGGWLRDLSPDTARALIQHTLPQGGPPALVFSEVRLAGGAVARVDPDAMAYSNRAERLIWISLAAVPAPEIAAAVSAHMTKLRDALAPALTGRTYMNFLEGEEARGRTREGYSPAALRRLQQVKARYDPDNLMSLGYDLR